MAGMMGVLEKVMPVPKDYTAEFLRTSAGVTNIGSNAKARREPGYNPRPLEEGIVETMEHEMRGLAPMVMLNPLKRSKAHCTSATVGF